MQNAQNVFESLQGHGNFRFCPDTSSIVRPLAMFCRFFDRVACDYALAANGGAAEGAAPTLNEAALGFSA